MADNGVNKGRRRFLVGATSVVGAVGAVGVAVPFVASWQPSARARAAGAPVQADISKLEPGERMTVEWRGRPIWIINRTPEMIERTESLGEGVLADPESTEPQQPAYIEGHMRSIRPEIGVLIGICTHLGCSPLFRPEPDAEASALITGRVASSVLAMVLALTWLVACSATFPPQPTLRCHPTALKMTISLSSAKMRRLPNG